MHVLRDRKKTKSGETRTYIALAQSVWTTSKSGKNVSKPVIFARLGVEEDLDIETVSSARDAIHRYIQRRLAEERRTLESVSQAADELTGLAPTLKLLTSRQYGMRVLADEVWKKLGLNRHLRRLARRHEVQFDLERLVFGMVLNRLAAPRSKRACNEWLRQTAWFPEAEGWEVHHFYRALDLLEEHEEEILTALRESLLKRGLDDELALLLVDTTATYMESDLDDEERKAVLEAWELYDKGGGEQPSLPRPQVVNEPALRMRGHSKDHRRDKPQVVIGAVADQHGRLLHLQTFEGNRNDQKTTLELVQPVLRQLPPGHGRPVVVMDSGTGGGPNLAALDELEEGVDRVSAVRLRNLKFAEDKVLSIPGRWRHWPDKPDFTYRVVMADAETSPSGRPELWVATRNAREASGVKMKLDKHEARVRAILDKDDSLEDHNAEVCALRSHKTLKRYVRESKDGSRLLLNRDRLRLERRRAGVKVIRSTLVDLPPETTLDVYQAQLKLEANFRAFKTPLRLRPMYHRKDSRIRAHVLMCALALACTQELEVATGLTLDRLRDLFGNIQAAQMEQGKTRFWMRQEWTKEQAKVLKAIGVEDLPMRWGAEQVEDDRS